MNVVVEAIVRAAPSDNVVIVRAAHVSAGLVRQGRAGNVAEGTIVVGRVVRVVKASAAVRGMNAVTRPSLSRCRKWKFNFVPMTTASIHWRVRSR